MHYICVYIFKIVNYMISLFFFKILSFEPSLLLFISEIPILNIFRSNIRKSRRRSSMGQFLYLSYFALYFIKKFPIFLDSELGCRRALNSFWKNLAKVGITQTLIYCVNCFNCNVKFSFSFSCTFFNSAFKYTLG